MRLSLIICSLVASFSSATAGGPIPIPELIFSFDAAFGDYMVLQQAPAHAAVYGFLDFNAAVANAVVSVTMTPDGGTPTTIQATLNTTAQTFGPDWGVRPCPTCQAMPPPYNPWNTPLASWKVLLPPTVAGGATPNYSITATCVGCSSTAPTTISLSNVVFGGK